MFNTARLSEDEISNKKLKINNKINLNNIIN